MGVYQSCCLALILGVNSGFLFADDLCIKYANLCANSQPTINTINATNNTNLQNNANTLTASLSAIDAQLQIDLQNIDNQLTADLLVVTTKQQNSLATLSAQLQTDNSNLTTQLTTALAASNNQLQTQLTASTNSLNAALLASDNQLQLDLVGKNALEAAALQAQNSLEQDALRAQNTLEQNVLRATNQAEQDTLTAKNQLQKDALTTQNSIDVALVNSQSQAEKTAITSSSQVNKATVIATSQAQTEREKLLIAVKNQQSELENTLGELTVIIDQKESQEVENFNDSLTAIENGIISIDTARANIAKLEAQLKDLGVTERARLLAEIATLKATLDTLETKLVAQYDKDYSLFLSANRLINQISFSSIFSQFDFSLNYNGTTFDSEQINNNYQSMTNVGFYFSQDSFLVPLFYNLTEHIAVGATIPIEQSISSALLHLRLHTQQGVFDYSDIQFDNYIDNNEWHPGVSLNLKENYSDLGFSFLGSLKETKDNYLNFHNQAGISFNTRFGVILAQYSRNLFFENYDGSNVVLNEVILGYRQPWTIFGLLPAPIDLDWVANIPINEKLYITSHVYDLTPPEATFFIGFSQKF